MTARALRGFVVDDEPLAVNRLVAMVRRTGRVDVVGTATDPAEAITALADAAIDVLFLDIHIPEIDGFALLERLPRPPLVVFTTAHDEHALRAFQVLAIDYLLKPVGRAERDRALDKLDRLVTAPDAAPAPDAIAALRAAIDSARAPGRIASRLGDRVTLLDLDQISHFHAADKLTYAVAGGREHVIDETLAALERRLDPARFVRVHRAALVNVAFVAELLPDGGGLAVRLRVAAGTQLAVARDRVRPLKDKLGISFGSPGSTELIGVRGSRPYPLDAVCRPNKLRNPFEKVEHRPMYAVIETGGKQYRVQPGETVVVETLPGDAGDAIEFGRVLLISDDVSVAVGRPAIEGARVTGQIVEQGLGEKLIVYKFKRRKNQRKRNGHRQPYTAVKIQSVVGPQ